MSKMDIGAGIIIGMCLTILMVLITGYPSNDECSCPLYPEEVCSYSDKDISITGCHVVDIYVEEKIYQDNKAKKCPKCPECPVCDELLFYDGDWDTYYYNYTIPAINWTMWEPDSIIYLPIPCEGVSPKVQWMSNILNKNGNQ